VSSFPAFALQLVLRIDSCWVYQGGFFLPLGFSVGHATLKAVLHATANLYTVSSSSCGGDICQNFFVPVPVGSSRVREADRQGRIKGQYSFYESMVSFLTAPTSESDTKVRSMIVWQALVMNEGKLPLA